MDMNLARVFVSIYETGSLTVAADRLYVTQSAVSQSLSRLRRELDDPLFERSGRAMEPTQIAHHVYPEFRDATVGIDTVISGIRGFDAASTTRRFRIAMSELGEIGWLPGIAKKMNAIAPTAHLEVIPTDAALLPEWLSRGVVDVAITPVDVGVGYLSVAAKWQEYGVAMSSENPFADGGLNLEEYSNAPRAVVVSDSAAAILAAAEAGAGVRQEPAVLLQHYATLPLLLVSRPSLIAAVPTSIAEGWAAGWPLTVRSLPFEMAPVQIRVYRRASSQQLAALEWFYRLVCSVVSSTVGRFDTIQGRDDHMS